MDKTAKELFIATASTAIIEKISNAPFTAKNVISVEPYVLDDDAISITGYVSFSVPLAKEIGIDAKYAGFNFESIFHQCTLNEKLGTYSGNTENFELVFGEMDFCLTFANHVNKNGNVDWDFDSPLLIDCQERSQICKSVFERVFSVITNECKQKRLSEIFEILKTSSPIPTS